MKRRQFLRTAGALGLTGASVSLAGCLRGTGSGGGKPISVEGLPELSGDLTVYLGRGEGGLYGDIVKAVEARNPHLNLEVRRASSAALANTILEEAKVGTPRPDVFWSIDAGSLGAVANAGLAREVPTDLLNRVKREFRYDRWVGISGRVRTIPYNTERFSASDIPSDVMAFAESDFDIGWAPSYGAFQSFVTAMRLTEGEERTREWLLSVKERATGYGGELGATMAVAGREVDVGFANHYYTLRLKQGRPDAAVGLAFTEGDAGSLVNASGALVLSEGETPLNFVRYLLSAEVQGFLAREGFEIPLVPGVETPEGIPPLESIEPPAVDLTQLADVRPTLDLMREAGVL